MPGPQCGSGVAVVGDESRTSTPTQSAGIAIGFSRHASPTRRLRLLPMAVVAGLSWSLQTEVSFVRPGNVG
jgi:hypothetical protein